MNFTHHPRTLGIAAVLILTALPGRADDKSRSPRARSDVKDTAVCRVQRVPAGLPGVTEASGIAASRRTPGILWTHGDSYRGTPVLFAFDASGRPRGKVSLDGIEVRDWEDIAVGGCGSGSCVYIADIGDNAASRQSITIYRIPEPLPGDVSVPAAEAFHATFPDGPQDAEAIAVTPDGAIFIVTKGETRGIGVYRFPRTPRPGSRTELQQVAAMGRDGRGARESRVTGASASPDGKWVALRTHASVLFFDATRFASGDVQAALRFSTAALKEPQGEGVAFGEGGRLYLAGEGGAKGGTGTLATGTCDLIAPQTLKP